jgi:signal transduction histidine kinase
MIRPVIPILKAVSIVLAASLSGAITLYGVTLGYWGLSFGGVLMVLWACAVSGVVAARGSVTHPDEPADQQEERTHDRAIIERLLLDLVPVPLIAIDDNAARAINRASRQMFATDDRILPCPEGLVDPLCTVFKIGNRMWRIDRVSVSKRNAALSLAALIDVEKDRIAAEDTARAELTEVLGHELMNGLSPIVSLAEAALSVFEQEQSDGELLREILGFLSRRTEALHRFAERYHSLAKLPQPELQNVAVETLVGDLKSAFEHAWPSVTLDVKGDICGEFQLDPDLVHQALWAILQNAAQAIGPQSEPRVEMRFERTAARLRISIQDHGEGISPDTAPFVFRPFYTTKKNGSGLGLALAQQIARAHGGTLQLANYKPAEFLMCLPQHKSQDQQV